MRLYLTSDGFGSEPGRLVDLVGGAGSRIAVVCNAVDAMPSVAREARVERELDGLRELGLEPEEVDLRTLFGAEVAAVRARFAPFAAVWLRGGNAFVLRRALSQSGADVALPALLDAGALAWGGTSAGAIVAGTSLRGLEAMCDPAAAPHGYDPEPISTGLALVPYAIAPHAGSAVDEAPAADAAIETWTAAKVPHRALGDGMTIIVDGAATSTTPRRSPD